MCKPNKALHLNGLKAKQGLMVLRDIKTKNVVLGLISRSNHIFKEGERRKGRRKLGFARDQALV